MRMAMCHSDRPYVAKGLCYQCYHVAYNAAHKVDKDAYNAAHKAERHIRYVARKEEVRSHLYLRIYGFTLADYEVILAAQGGVCKICGATKPGGGPGQRRFYVDHNHRTGEIRGLLCSKCNSGLGYFRDDRSILESAGLYLRGVV